MGRVQKFFRGVVYGLSLLFMCCAGVFVSFGQESGPEWGKLKTSDGQQLRTVFYEAPYDQISPLTIVFLQGRSSFIEKYQDVLEKLNKMGYRVWSFDLRGQGGSSRAFPKQPHKLHIDSFDTYLADLNFLIREKVRSQTAGPIILIGSSAGGHLALRYLQDYPGKVQGAILISPMLEVFTPPIPRVIAPLCARFLCWLGFEHSYALGHGDFELKRESFAGNRTTHNPEKFKRQCEMVKAHPQFVTGGVTYGWAQALFQSLAKQKDLQALDNINVPVLILEGGQDRVVDHSQNDYFVNNVQNLHRQIYPNAFHGLMIEREEIVEKVWQDIAAFLKNKV